MSDGTTKNTMDNNPKETVQETDAVVETTVETPATEEVSTEEAQSETSENSSSTTEESEDLTSLIEEEKKSGKPDPQKARERFLQNRQQESEESEGGDSVISDEEKPLTRSEVEALLTERTNQVLREAHGDQIDSISSELADSEQEAELIKEIHKNRIFPQGMSIRDQLGEARAIATEKRLRAKNSELARKINSQQTAVKNTASTQRDSDGSPEPELASDIKSSLQRAGYAFNNQANRYEKKLPNGKLLVKEGNNPPRMVG